MGIVALIVNHTCIKLNTESFIMINEAEEDIAVIATSIPNNDSVLKMKFHLVEVCILNYLFIGKIYCISKTD